jgi:hypothetical protein
VCRRGSICIPFRSICDKISDRYIELRQKSEAKGRFLRLNTPTFQTFKYQDSERNTALSSSLHKALSKWLAHFLGTSITNIPQYSLLRKSPMLGLLCVFSNCKLLVADGYYSALHAQQKKLYATKTKIKWPGMFHPDSRCWEFELFGRLFFKSLPSYQVVMCSVSQKRDPFTFTHILGKY